MKRGKYLAMTTPDAGLHGFASAAAPLLVIVGPTAAGKTALAVRLAQALDGEIISADSRQIYRRMDIGTAKPSAEEQAAAPHHMLDIVNPDQVLTAAQYQRMAYALVAEIRGRARLPMLVGGTGQYVHAVVEGWSIPEVAPQPALRSRLEARAAAEGAGALHAYLATLDAVAAGRIDYRNVRRVIGALEVCLVTGQPISELQRKSPPPYQVYQLGVTRPRPELYARIDARVDAMLAAGLVDEVRRLVDSGYSWDLPSMTGLGYRQLGAYLRAELSLADALAVIKKQTRRFVHQQATWFRPDDPVIHWVDPGAVSLSEILAQIRIPPAIRGDL
jgi:tRNA dimethylallyltransferase